MAAHCSSTCLITTMLATADIFAFHNAHSPLAPPPPNWHSLPGPLSLALALGMQLPPTHPPRTSRHHVMHTAALLMQQHRGRVRKQSACTNGLRCGQCAPADRYAVVFDVLDFTCWRSFLRMEIEFIRTEAPPRVPRHSLSNHNIKCQFC